MAESHDWSAPPTRGETGCMATPVRALRAGLDGDVVIWSGDPLDIYSRAERVLISGTEVYSLADGVRERRERF